MKRLYLAVLAMLLTLSACKISFDDDYDDHDRDYKHRTVTTTVADLKNLRDDTDVRLTGVLEERLGREWYEFSDDTGSIDVEIEYEVWRRSGLNRNALPMNVEITGEMDKERRWLEIDVDTIKAL